MMMLLLWWIFILLEIQPLSCQIFCSPATSIGFDFAKQIATVPLGGANVPDGTFHDECMLKGGSDEYCLSLARYPDMQRRCLAYGDCINTCKSIYGTPDMALVFNDCVQACPTKLRSFCDAFTDYRAMRNQVLPKIPTAIVDYKLQVASGDFSSRTSATITSWFSLRFKDTAVCNATETGSCSDAMYKLPSSFFTTDFAVAANSLMVSNVRQFPDIQFKFDPKTSRLLRIGSSSTRAGNGAFWTTGCTPPVVTLRVQYALTKQRSMGSTVVGDSSGEVACYNRTLYLIDVQDEPQPYLCRFIYTVDQLRGRLELPTYGATYELRRLNALQWMQGEAFAISMDGVRQMLFSTSQINNIFDCISPPGNKIGGVWSTPVSTQPGSCTPCLKKPASSHMQTRHCNHSLDGADDCCYSCTKGFMMTPSGVCILECRRNSGFDVTRGACVACPRGTFSAGGSDACKTCSEYGVTNARTDVTLGCVPCLPRFVAALDLCVPCPPNQIVQNRVCAPCPANSFLATGATRCQTCAVGTFLNSASSVCKTCPVNTFSSQIGATICAQCANGFYSIPNRTICLPCASIAKLPLARYFQPGCALQCTSLAYLNTTPYVLGGCAPCSSIALPSGTCAISGDCSQSRPCTNAPTRGSYYTGSAPIASNCICPFACLPGFSGPLCTPCVYGSQFNAKLHVPTTGCLYDCAPGFFRDSAKACTTPCVQLVDELAASRIRARVSEYGSASRPHYILGVCGSAATFPMAHVPFLRRGWWALLSDYTTHECGNALLETSESCDDGNTVSGDGCSSTCQVETSQYWDCDLIGSPCLPYCGWAMQATDPWGISLRGWLLPPCPNGLCSCASLSYYNLTRSGANRREWMASHLVPCNCGGNLQRTLPYQECTVANGGCRQCATGEYHDDLRGRCMTCGSDCLKGYHRNPQQPDNACKKTFSTSANLALIETQQQANIGCVPCPLPVGAVRYIDTNCRYMCYKDSTGESTSTDTYCSIDVASDGGCSGGSCMSCATGLASMRASYDNAIMRGDASYNGYYIDRCRDRIGHIWQPCDPSSKPSWASWSSASPTVGDSTGCAWECPYGTTFSYHKTCLPCAASPLCGPGEHWQSCDTWGTLKACVPCEGATPFSWQVWTSTSDICLPDCEAGVAWSALPQGECELCSAITCALGEMLKRCTPRSDTACPPCSDTYGSLPWKHEYITAGLCSTRCQSGYYMSNGVCKPCVPVNGPCENGQNQTSDCVDPANRKSAPLCQPCPFVLSQGEVWGAGCRIACGLGLVRINGSCIVCDIALCGLGQSGSCGDYLDCIPCSVKPHEVFTVPGSCTHRRCTDGYVRNDYQECIPVITQAPTTTPVFVDTDAIAGLIYPARGAKHSAIRS